MKPAEVAVDAVACYRLTRLATGDGITEPARSAILRQVYLAFRGEDDVADMEADAPHSTWTERAADDPDAPKLATLLVCRWCAGVWVAAGIAVARRRWPTRWAVVAEVATVAAAAGLLAGAEN